MFPMKSVIIFLFLYIKTNAVPPEACFANFRWEDCGKPPRRVLYYWKPGSRCEVGTWRGCLPNVNMFHDEYECVSTCICTARAQPPDYHAITATEEAQTITDITKAENVTSSGVTVDDQTTVGDKATEVVERNVTDTVENIPDVNDVDNVTSSVTVDDQTTVADNATEVLERNVTDTVENIPDVTDADNVTSSVTVDDQPTVTDNATEVVERNETETVENNNTTVEQANTTIADINATQTNSTV